MVLAVPADGPSRDKVSQTAEGARKKVTKVKEGFEAKVESKRLPKDVNLKPQPPAIAVRGRKREVVGKGPS